MSKSRTPDIWRFLKKSPRGLAVSNLHGLNPVKVICGIKQRCFLLGIWHLSLKQQSFVVSRLNLSFQGDPRSWLKSWWFGIMRFAFVASPQRLHSNARPPSPGLKNLSREGSVLLIKWKSNLRFAFKWERCRRVCILEHISFYFVLIHTALGSLTIALC